MSGWIPSPVRNVKPFVAVVQPGDSVSRIAHRMTGNANRWPELVGANLHKPLSTGSVAGSPYRVFESLEPNEHLMVPASWPDQGPGVVGATPPLHVIDPNQIGKLNLMGDRQQRPEPNSAAQVDVLTTTITPIVTTLLGGTTPANLPTGLGFPDISKVIAAWLPYLPTGINLQNPPSPISNPGAVGMWITLIESVTAFLAAAGLTTDQIDYLTHIPWDNSMPWSKIPWQQLIVGLDPVAKLGLPFWNMLFGAASGGGPISNKPSLNSAPGGDVKIDLLDPSTWTKEPFSSVNAFGWSNFLPAAAGIMPGDVPTTWGKIDDMELLGCIAQHPERAKELAQYADCFKGDMAKLKQYMCNPQLDASKCATAKVDPTKVLPPGVNWNCQPSPQCIADQLKPPTPGAAPVCPPPGTAFPACVPEWYKSITGQDINPPKQEEKKNENLPLYLGLGAAGIALVAGILVIAAAD